jgi:hypothetical protein
MGYNSIDPFVLLTELGPTPGTSIVERRGGSVQVSNDGGQTFAALGGGFGSDTIVQIPNSLAALKNALELLNEYRVNTSGSEESRWRVFLAVAGAQADKATAGTEAGGYEFSSGLPMVYVGPLADTAGLRKSGAGGTTTVDFLANGTAIASITASGNFLNVHGPFAAENQIRNSVSGSVAVATTIAWGITNITPVTVGTGTLNSINMTGWVAGSRLLMICPSGVTITHNVAGTGATILTPTGASIVTASKRAIPMYYDGTNVIVEG